MPEFTLQTTFLRRSRGSTRMSNWEPPRYAPRSRDENLAPLLPRAGRLSASSHSEDGPETQPRAKGEERRPKMTRGATRDGATDVGRPAHAIVLAAGSGERLRPVTERWLGEHRPKQYCTFVGTRSMLQHTLDRVKTVVPQRNIVTVIAQEHERYLASAVPAPFPGTLVRQPVEPRHRRRRLSAARLRARARSRCDRHDLPVRPLHLSRGPLPPVRDGQLSPVPRPRGLAAPARACRRPRSRPTTDGSRRLRRCPARRSLRCDRSSG